MSCAISNIVGLYALVLQKDNHWLIHSAFILAGVFVIIAISLAWRDEHFRLMVELEKNSNPEFQVEVTRLIHDVTPTQGIPWRDCGNTYVARLRLVNLRPAPSSVLEIYVTLDGHDKQFVAKPFNMARLRWVRDGITRVFEGVSTTERIGEEETIRDLLPCLLEPMTRGAHKDGWIYLPDLPKADSEESFSFYVVDAYGKPHGPFLSKAEMDGGNVTISQTV